MPFLQRREVPADGPRRAANTDLTTVAKEQKSWTMPEALKAADIGGAPSVRSIEPDDMSVAYQPIVECATGRLFAYEALARCRIEAFRSPAVLFERASAEQACGRLGRMVRDVAFANAGATPLFVNLHPDELSSRWLVRPDDPIGFHDEAVYLEITETAALSHYELCMNVLKELCLRAGAKLVVDDFGAGHSNLQRLLELEPDIVKLDLALTRNIHEDSRKQAVVRHMVNLCGELGAEVVAEGVETVEELSCVRDLGAHYVQGYLLARPGTPPPAHYWPYTAPPVKKKRSASRELAPLVVPPSPRVPGLPHSAPVIREKQRPAARARAAVSAPLAGVAGDPPVTTSGHYRQVARDSAVPTLPARAPGRPSQAPTMRPIPGKLGGPRS